MIAAEAALGAWMVLTRRTLAPLIGTTGLLIAFSTWVISANLKTPNLSCGCFGAQSLIGRDLTLAESLTRNGLLLIACAALTPESLASHARTHG